ncbi:hypothetical protein [Agromyces sp. Soil535]|uniref:DUF7144 family membrane protein n=1 Tax=Agromyces sp. Soil535 TaxID=1736390 RepID=UPI0006F26011|nr:hypothetical protein [Agromyces sp. Soil535]KRE21781.1 hypothetical protein ASG80_11830 [Agromyces sp. Soil535]
MSDQFGPKRPLGVTIVAALAIVSGAFDIIGGIALLATQSTPEVADAFGGAALATTLAIVEIAIGIIMLVIAYGLLRGNAISRIAATVVQVISLAGSIWIGIAQPSTLATEIVSALVALAILMLLWTGEATRYFKGLAPDEPTS